MLEPIRGIRARRALLGPGLDPVLDVWITFEDGVISEIGTGAGPSGLVTLTGEVVLPGLIDCHVHLTMDGGPDVEAALAALTTESALALARKNAMAQVTAGVTTVRDLGSFQHILLEHAADILPADEPAPSLVAAGAVSTPGGHGHFIAMLADDVEGYVEVTRALVARGARAIKLFATGGVITSGSQPGGVQMTPDELAAVVHVAHGAGVPVAAHAHGAAGIANAVNAGVDSVEHFSYLDDVDLAALRAGHTTLVSTLVATERFVRSPRRWSSRAETLDKIVSHAPHERAALQRSVREALPLAVGTDAGTTFNPHGWGMQDQAELLVAAGMPARAVLKSMTVTGAKLLREPAGSIEVGKRADLLAVGGNPLSDLTSLRNITEVVARGRPVSSTEGAA